MKIEIVLSEDDIRKAVTQYIINAMGIQISDKGWILTIEAKSNQNYKSEWEIAQFRGRIERIEEH